MHINDKKKEHIDAEAFRILALLEEKITPSVQPKTKKDYGSLDHTIGFDLTDKIVDAPQIFSEADHYGNTISKREVYDNRSIGLNEPDYVKLKKLANTISQEKSINHKVSKDFIGNKIFEWLIKTHKSKKADNTLSNFLLDEFQKEMSHLKIRFPILYLHIKNPFQIGKATFEYFTKDYFDKLIIHNRAKGSITSDENHEQLRKSHQGKVFVSISVTGEKKKAEEIALEYCSLAVDILKMCSDTTDFPFIKLGFDIDSRVKAATKAEVIITSADNELEDFNLNLYMPANHYSIGPDQWRRSVERQMGLFHEFLLDLPDEPTELQSLIINSIKRYGNAISNSNLHQRVVELFTILESLLLFDSNSPIIESVCKYCSKLVFKTVEDRRNAIELMKTMYDVRSKLIHHGKEAKFEMDNLRKLQLIVVMLLGILVQKTKTHNTKQSVLQEIEDAILQAYG
ncbi:HEPN domain-containing protein [Pedobacter sp. GR22-10]|uniref:HEPN domain-containing protein n=1 Tax=Pedobacter sp. GR22-10 TaxID=2994472 RepID=UPI0022474FBB|nr:HEPN domain-containing protein [Pedobacter sp. GR22-10]MCX2429907.1 HEPN domain-containing protein [Pedobacter sp. GR22-10]